MFFLPGSFFIEAGFASFEPGFPKKRFVFWFVLWSLCCASAECSLLVPAVEMSALQRSSSGSTQVRVLLVLPGDADFFGEMLPGSQLQGK